MLGSDILRWNQKYLLSGLAVEGERSQDAFMVLA